MRGPSDMRAPPRHTGSRWGSAAALGSIDSPVNPSRTGPLRTDRLGDEPAQRHMGAVSVVTRKLEGWTASYQNPLRPCGKLARMCKLVAPECCVPPPRSKPNFLSWTPRVPSVAWVRLLLMLMSTSVALFSRTLVTAAENPGSSGQRRGLGSRGAPPAVVSEVESTVLEALLSQPSTSTEKPGADSAANGDLAKCLTTDLGCTERIHDPDRLVVSVTERPLVVLPKRNQERSSLAWHVNVDERCSDDAFD